MRYTDPLQEISTVFGSYQDQLSTFSVKCFSSNVRVQADSRSSFLLWPIHWHGSFLSAFVALVRRPIRALSCSPLVNLQPLDVASSFHIKAGLEDVPGELQTMCRAPPYEASLSVRGGADTGKNVEPEAVCLAR